MALETLNKLSVKSLGFVQALGVTIYCLLVGLIFFKGNEIFGRPNLYLGPVMFLILFIVSALICAAIVFYNPYKFFFDGKKKEAVDLVVWTTAWLFLSFVISLFLALVLR